MWQLEQLRTNFILTKGCLSTFIPCRFFLFIGTANRYFSELYPIIFTSRDILSFVNENHRSKFDKLK